MAFSIVADSNTHIVSVNGLVNLSTGETIDSATVEFSIYEFGGETLYTAGGQGWPVELDSEGDGDYIGSFNADLEEGCSYEARLTITSGVNVLTKRRRFIPTTNKL